MNSHVRVPTLPHTLAAIARTAARLCEANEALIYQVEGDSLVPVAKHGPVPAKQKPEEAVPLGRDSVTGRAVIDRRTIHIRGKAVAAPTTSPGRRGARRATGEGILLAMPLVRGERAIGAILVRRTRPRPFRAGQIALLEAFADQAALAIDHARLSAELGVRDSELEAKNRELGETREQQTATSEILRVISRSPADIQPVFDAIVRSASGLCDGHWAVAVRFDGELIHLAAEHNIRPGAPSLAGLFPCRPSRDLGPARAILEAAPVHIPDVEKEPGYRREVAGARSARSILAVPMLREGAPIGAIAVSRPTPGPFPSSHVELLITFADQAVIAIENARLFTELGARNRELSVALERQTATSEILRVISDSRTDLQPVFDTIVRSAVRLCRGIRGSVIRFDGELLRLVANHNVTAEAAEDLGLIFPRAPGSDHISGRAVLTRSVVHVPDIDHAPDLLVTPALRRGLGVRAIIGVPMLRDGEPIGVIVVARTEPEAFSDTEIELLQTFADQAVIAIENVRLFTELEARNRQLTEALDQQTATAEILRVISRSPTDVQPVLDAVAESAARLCGANDALVLRVEDGLMRRVAQFGPLPAGLVRPIVRESVAGRAILECRTIHIHDVFGEGAEYPVTAEQQQAMGLRTLLVSPLVRDGAAIGAIMIRRREVQPFTDKQIALLQTFADQAVIAIENVRLFQELQASNAELTEALTQQTATSEILRVISSSPTNIQPVLDAVAESAGRLCESFDTTIFRVDGDRLRLVAHHGPIAYGTVGEFSLPLIRGTVGGRSVLDGRTVHVADVQAEADEFPEASEFGRRLGVRTILHVPLMREGVAIGTIQLGRTEAQLFTERQVALLQTFADQAVIAIENVRLFTELEARNRDLSQALDRQTATAEILRAISQAQTEVQPVFEAIADATMRLFGAWSALVFRYDDELIRLAAARGGLPGSSESVMERLQAPRPPADDTPQGRAVMTRAVQHVVDVGLDLSWGPEFREGARVRGFRSVVSVPMLRGGDAVGVITVSRGQVGGFTPAEIALLQTFADQAVIAVENARLLTELQARNADLTEALGRQTATAEILRVIGTSPTDAQPVFEGIARSGVRVCGALGCVVFLVEGDMLRVAATHGVRPERVERFQSQFPAPLTAEDDATRAVRERRIFHLADIEQNPEARPEQVEFARLGGYRTRLMVPMVRGDSALGLIAVTREAPTPFSDRQVDLLRTFADQAVIAIENVRLFKELEARNRDLTEALEQQTATADILRVISSAPTGVQPTFEAIARAATRLCEADLAGLFQFDGELIHFVAQHGRTPEEVDAARRAFPQPPSHRSVTARAILAAAAVQIPDVREDPELDDSLRMFRAVLSVPMMQDGRALGVITVARRVMRPFTDKQIALLETFADQAVIAIENVRLFTELEARTRELTQSVEQLTALGEVGRAVSSTLDLETLLDTIVARAVQLSGTSGGLIYEYEESSQEFHLRAAHWMEDELVAALRAAPVRLGEGATGRAAALRTPVQVPDIPADQEYALPRLRPLLDRLGYRSLLSVPLLFEQRIMGALLVWRRQAGPFTPEVVSLLQTFASQSCLAINNARLFREIEDKGRELEVASRHKSQFLANMSHELRTPLNAILGYTELIVDGTYGEVPERMGEVLDRVDKSGRHLLGLINDILDLSKIEAGQLKLVPVDYSMEDIVRSVAAATEPLAAARQLALVVSVAPDLPLGWGDARRLNQVLLNLVGNAIKFTDTGRVTVEARVAGEAFVVAVTDTGPGIGESDRERIFEEFQQAETTTRGAKGGTGLGLAISRRIVAMHGGRLWLESALGQGSTFTFTVPVRMAELGAAG